MGCCLGNLLGCAAYCGNGVIDKIASKAGISSPTLKMLIGETFSFALIIIGILGVSPVLPMNTTLAVMGFIMPGITLALVNPCIYKGRQFFSMDN